MIRTEIHLGDKLPIDRRKAAIIAQTASKYESTLTLEKDGTVLNAKSMLGMLSQSMPRDGVMDLVADGADEREATQDIVQTLAQL